MSFREANTDFFSYQGTIGRKDYIVNLLILSAIYVGLSLLRFENFRQYITIEFINSVLTWLIWFAKFMVIMSGLSMVYRRLNDITHNRPSSYAAFTGKLFVILFVLPAFYLYCLRYFIDIMPFIQNILDLVVTYILIPLGAILMLLLCFIKGK
ncbi:MAG: hypothetical protein LUG16_03900 [Candidatus Gastranaerophilales bacterium]|nr:hypothetical protein [Candidatus Gastranaerophilales bacterium]